MQKIKTLSLLIFIISLISCRSEDPKFPVNKRYWDIQDYKDVMLELKFGEDKQNLPRFSNVKNRVIVQKFTDQENFNVVLDDDELGLKYRNEVAEDFFNIWDDMGAVYAERDRQDKYVYDQEMLEVWHFGLALQLKYFKLGNDLILEDSTNPKSRTVQNNINMNIEALHNNFKIYLKLINEEDSFSEKGKKKLAQGIDKYFIQLVELYPKADYNSIMKEAKTLKEKTDSEDIKTSLSNFIEKIQQTT